MSGEKTYALLKESLNGKRRNFLKGAALTGISALLPSFVCASALGVEKVRLVIPYPAGGSTDIVGRIVSNSVGKILKTTIIPDNKGGAAGLIGIDTVARSAPDGATLGISGIGTTVLLGITNSKMPYKRERDLDVIAHLGSFGNVIVAHPNAPFNTLADVIAAGKKGGSSLSCGTAIAGSPSHMTLEYLRAESGLNALGVPYLGHSQILTDLMGGQIQLGLISVPQSADLITAGKLKAIAVTSARRAAKLPSVPTVQESGVKDFEASLWNVLVARRGTPKAMQDALNAAVNTAFQQPDVRKQLDQLNIEFTPHTLAEVAEFVQKEDQKWHRIANKAGVVAA